MNIPHRKTLVLQTTDILRTAISDGTWDGHLPGERELCKRLHVSRPTLRAALAIIEREKIIESAHGKSRRIISGKRPRRQRKSGTVVLVTPVPLYSMSRNRIYLFDHLHRVLSDNNFNFTFVTNPAFASSQPKVALAKLRREHPADVYLLALTSRHVQEWFVNADVPSIIIGSSFPGVTIPTIECDYPATGRHAAGILLGRGHRRIIVAAPDTKLAGDIETVDSFEQTIAQSGHSGTVCHRLMYANDPEAIIGEWDQLRQLENPPTAAFTIYSQVAASLLTHLLGSGVRIPDEFSILCRDSAPLIEWTAPPIAHYKLPLEYFATKLSALVLQISNSGTTPDLHTTIMPNLYTAGSIGYRD